MDAPEPDKTASSAPQRTRHHAQNPRRHQPTGVRTSHMPITNSVDAPGPQVPDLRLRDSHGLPGPHKTRSTTCAMWYPGTARSPGPERLLARQSGIAGCSVVSRSPVRPSHLSRDVTSPGWTSPFLPPSRRRARHRRNPRGSGYARTVVYTRLCRQSVIRARALPQFLRARPCSLITAPCDRLAPASVVARATQQVARRADRVVHAHPSPATACNFPYS